MEYAAALAYLDDHASYDKTGRVDDPSTDSIAALCSAMGDPQHAQPVIHVTGTNGKGSTVQMISRLLMAQGLTVGTYTSPHLERINERIKRNGEPISDDEFAEQIAGIAAVEGITGVRPTYFEAVTAAAFRWFADVAVDITVIEVGMLGRWDATNIVDAQVAVVTNIALDHTEFAGPALADIAREKAGIIKPGTAAVIGETDPALVEIFRAEGGASTLVRGEAFGTVDNSLAIGGRALDLRTPTTIYSDVFLPLHGAHQGTTPPLRWPPSRRSSRPRWPTTSSTRASPTSRCQAGSRCSACSRWRSSTAPTTRPAPTCAPTCSSEISTPRAAGSWWSARSVTPTRCWRRSAPTSSMSYTPAPPRRRGAFQAQDVARAARQLGCDEVYVHDSVEAACKAAMQHAGADDAILACGSIYVAGAARPALRRYAN